MEFWGLEVKPGTTVRCEPGDDYILHLSQAALGEIKKASDNALMYVKVDDRKLAIGTLSVDKHPQIQFDLVFEKDFELSHTSKAASVFFSGYKVHQPAEGDEMDLDSEEDEEDEEEGELNIPVIKENGRGKAEAKEEQKSQGKAGATASKTNAAAKHAEKEKKDSDDGDEDETDDSDEDDGLCPEEGDSDGSSEEDDSSEDDEEDDSDGEDDSDEHEEETPKKPEVGKKRAAENSLKTPASDKKAKVATPSGQKTGGKKGTHVATPHPAKQASKNPTKNDKSTEKSSRSGGSIPCKSCNKTFNSEMALQSHSKAKH